MRKMPAGAGFFFLHTSVESQSFQKRVCKKKKRCVSSVFSHFDFWLGGTSEATPERALKAIAFKNEYVKGKSDALAAYFLILTFG